MGKPKFVRYFDGKKFLFTAVKITKKEAEKAIKKIRDRGDNARRVKIKSGYLIYYHSRDM